MHGCREAVEAPPGLAELELSLEGAADSEPAGEAVPVRVLVQPASRNHISIVCRSVEASLRFYTDVLGFVPIRRPGSFDFDGAWYVSCLY